MNGSGDGADIGGVVERDGDGGYGGQRLAVVAAVLGFLVVYLVSNEVIGALAVAAVVYAFVHEQMSEDDEDGEVGDSDEATGSGDADRGFGESVNRSSADAVEGPEGTVLAPPADDAVDARYDVVLTSPHPVEVELERTDRLDELRWLGRLVERLPFDLPWIDRLFADPPLRVTEEVKRRVTNDLDARVSEGFDDTGRRVAVAVVEADTDRFRYEVSYLGDRAA